MPIYGRFEINGAARHGEVVGDTIHLVDDLFGARAKTGEQLPLAGAKILAPVAPSKLFAVGLNYADHAKESGKDIPEVPLMWFKAPSSIIGQGESVELVHPDHRIDFEAELTVVIGKRCKGVKEVEAAAYILGYTQGQDISDRVIQNSESQWARAKSADTYTALGPFIYTDLDPANLPIQCLVNGEVKQDSSTEQLIFKVPELVAFLSESMTFEPGDCIMTGTPPGVGPLKAGDVIETRIADMAPLVNPVRNAKL